MPINTIDNLTLIVSLVSAFIAIAMFVIASIQTRIQKRNLNLALFNSRYKVYIDSQKLYQEYTNGYISDITFSHFIASFHASELLFPSKSGIYKFLDKVHECAVSFNGTKRAMQSTDEPTALEMIYEYNREASSNLNCFFKRANQVNEALY
ncbi:MULTISPECIES: hypothetical protein [unclassified Pseudoalteromonas]|uniref:hypothetical protein n=1 Tax=unclassified Pseudoalteromonas TaxID=194690 RepID=UPI0016027F32|nr:MULTISPECIES: hypothetical protein [unclassified Pseudoalteromonas]MBB1351650.1 hypothetical protein [Pseudoalteromonas sp. SG45-3]MBB1357726.1 hypothetical protein [Pseudoalteromonas sp. SG45-6]